MIEQLVDQVSSYASDIDGVIILVGWFCLVWFVLAEVVFFGFCFFFRRKEGKKALYVNPAFTMHFEGWTAAESKPMLDYLYQHATLMEHTTRFKWAEGSIAIWDNRCTWHYALNDYHGHRRHMRRATINGDKPR